MVVAVSAVGRTAAAGAGDDRAALPLPVLLRVCGEAGRRCAAGAGDRTGSNDRETAGDGFRPGGWGARALLRGDVPLRVLDAGDRCREDDPDVEPAFRWALDVRDRAAVLGVAVPGADLAAAVDAVRDPSSSA